jgi:hypothetical protein
MRFYNITKAKLFAVREEQCCRSRRATLPFTKSNVAVHEEYVAVRERQIKATNQKKKTHDRFRIFGKE